jgi:hypothetical protein
MFLELPQISPGSETFQAEEGLSRELQILTPEADSNFKELTVGKGDC